MGFLFGPAPVRRTTAYLEACKLMFRPRVKIMEIHYNNYWKDRYNPNRIPYPQHDSHYGLRFVLVFFLLDLYVYICIVYREFYFWHMPQVQYMNPNVQIVRFTEKSPHPFIRCWLDDGRDVLFDCDSQTKQTIMERLIKTLGKTPEMIQYERATNVKQVSEDNQAIFGVDRKRFCMCEVIGQCPCPSVVKLPKTLVGKYTYFMKDDLMKLEKEIVEEDKPFEDYEPPFVAKMRFFDR